MSYLLQDAIQGNTSHLVVMSPHSLLICDSVSVFPYFSWTWQSSAARQRYWSVPYSGLFCCFSYIHVGATDFLRRNSRSEVPCSSHRIKGTCHSHDSTVDVNFYHLAKTVLARILHCKVTISPYFILRKWVTKSSSPSRGKSVRGKGKSKINLYLL